MFTIGPLTNKNAIILPLGYLNNIHFVNALLRLCSTPRIWSILYVSSQYICSALTE